MCGTKPPAPPLYNAIVWQCRRTAPLVDQLIQQGLTDHIKATTGLLPDASLRHQDRWILDHVEGAQQRAERGELLFGTVDTWLLCEADRRRCTRDRCHQRLPHHAV